MPWDTYASQPDQPSQETIDAFTNRGDAPAGWNWASQYTGAGNENMGRGQNPVSSGYGGYSGPHDVLRDLGGAGGWTSTGSKVGLGRFDPATGQVTPTETSAGGGWSFQDLAKLAAMGAVGYLSGAGAGGEGAGAGLGGATEPVASIADLSSLGATEPVASLGSTGVTNPGTTFVDYGAAPAAGGGVPPVGGAVPAAGGGLFTPQNLQVGASLLGAGLQTNSINQAANAQRDAFNQATALQRGIYNDTVARNQPFVTGGTNALEKMLIGLGITAGPDSGNLLRQVTPENVQSDPGYQWAQQQGEKGLQRNFAARGLTGSGRGLLEASRFNTGNATKYFDNAFNRNQSANLQNFNMLAGPAQMGQASANQTAAYGANFGNTAGANIRGAGADSGAASLARGNVWQDVLNQGVSAYTRPTSQTPLATGRPLYDPYTGQPLG